MDRADHSRIRARAEKEGLSLCDYMLQEIRLGAIAGKPKRTLFAACPNSIAVIDAALEAARRAEAPILFAATLNQVDLDGGYTGLTQHEFVELVREKAQAMDFQGPIAVCLDHGGPWLKDKQAKEKWPLDRAMQGVKDSLIASVDAGYDLLHIDPTVDITLAPGQTIAIETVIARTVELIAHAEAHRRKNQLPPIGYEVGTEEVHGGIADTNVVKEFLDGLKAGLAAADLKDVWPCFVVGKVGTDLHTTDFDPQMASDLAKILRRYKSAIKGHYCDYVKDIDKFPESGMGGANVGPEFTEAEYEILLELCAEEKEKLGKKRADESSNFASVLEDAVVESGRWLKWLNPSERDKDFTQLKPERRKWLTGTGCRYVWANPEVREARRRLYGHLGGLEVVARVRDAIVAKMTKYYKAFNLERLMRTL